MYLMDDALGAREVITSPHFCCAGDRNLNGPGSPTQALVREPRTCTRPASRRPCGLCSLFFGIFHI